MSRAKSTDTRPALPAKTASLFDTCLSRHRADEVAKERMTRRARAIAEELGAVEVRDSLGRVEYAITCPHSHCGRVTYIGEQLGAWDAYVRGPGRDCEGTSRIRSYLRRRLEEQEGR